jgi:hypothetical protein
VRISIDRAPVAVKIIQLIRAMGSVAGFDRSFTVTDVQIMFPIYRAARP